jgi:hypothetical protein
MNFDTKLPKAGKIYCFQEDVFECIKIYNRGLIIMELILILTPTNKHPEQITRINDYAEKVCERK